ncbi:MAG: hypothetical protein JST67_01740 [Bacteroidetes bacterium]|nr:hypothetical protein [Bacteroidota bacterium]
MTALKKMGVKMFVISTLSLFLLSSCFVNRTTVGIGPVGASMHDQTYVKAKQHYILFGLIPLNRPVLSVPPAGIGYEVKSSFGFFDGFFTLITAGLYGQRTERILVNKQDMQGLQNYQQEHQKP